jgi:hypothetical protein
MRVNQCCAAVASLLFFAACASTGSPAAPPRSSQEGLADSVAWGEAVADASLRSGLLDVYLDEAGGRVLLGLPAPSANGVVGSYLYIEGLTTGLGSNPVGLDRGQLGDSRVLEIRRIGHRVLFEQPNLGYRALTDDPAEARATRQAFATSVLWAGDAEVVDASGRSLVDVTSFLIRDAHGVARRLAETEQGKYALDPARSAIDFEACLAFPDNLEFEAVLTWHGEAEGDFVRDTAPTPDAITLVQHHSLVRLPDDGYQPREFDPRMGSFAVSFLDYAAALDEPIRRQWIVRHRLERTDPNTESSPAKEPLVYYVDPGTPEPIRSALVEGASWWADAFASAGFEDAFRVEILPDGAHPLDVRYNVIQWVHRSTRGWSYGGGVVDPRTGEMLKGHVSLGSLRIRQDILLFEGLSGSARTGSGAPDDPVELALARIRQLAAHEVGHTLGFNHNFAASTYGRASVMDYPAPWVRLDGDGALDFSQVYAVGAGAWDKHAANWAYREVAPEADEAEALAEIVEWGLEEGMLFLSDADARPPGAAHPAAGLWDNGADAVTELEQVLAVRRSALAEFGPENLALGRPLALLEEVLAPLYFHHRYQLAVTAKMVGGVDYRYKVRGDVQPLPRPIAPERQREALSVILQAMSPAELALPESVSAVMHPRASGLEANRELFRGRTAPTFDPVGAAAAAADLAVASLLQPERLNRLAAASAREAAALGPAEVLAGVVETAFAEGEPRLAGERAAIQEIVVRRLAELAADSGAAVTVRAAAEEALQNLPGDDSDVAGYLARAAERWLERTTAGIDEARPAPELPPGDPIGDGLPSLTRCSWAEGANWNGGR